MNDQPSNETIGIGQALAALVTSITALGQASTTFARKQTAQNADRVIACTNAVDTAMAMLTMSIPPAIDQTRSQIEAWRARQRMMFGDAGFGVVSAVAKGEES